MPVKSPFRSPRQGLRAPLLAAAALAALPWPALAAAPAVDPGLPSYVPVRAVRPPAGAPYVRRDGVVQIRGTDNAQAMLEALDALYVRTHPGTRFALQLKGTGTGIPNLAHGVTPFAPMGRAVTPVELIPYEKVVGEGPLEIRVARASNTSTSKATSLAVYANTTNPVSHLTMQQLAQIFTTGNPGGDFSRWGQLGGQKAWAGAAIHPVSTPEGSGFTTALTPTFFGGRPLTPEADLYPNGTEILRRISQDAQAIGIAAIGRSAPNVKMLAIGEGPAGPFSTGTLEEMRAGAYPLARYFYAYVRRQKGQPLDPLVKEYLRMVLSKEGQAIIAAEPDGYLPLTAQEAAQELAKLERAQ